MNSDFLSRLRAANTDRQAAWKEATAELPREELLALLMVAFRAIELAGEVGEALNVVKKLMRERLGWRGSRATPEDLRDELGDVQITLDLLALELGEAIAPATAAKFNKTSEKVGLPQRLEP